MGVPLRVALYASIFLLFPPCPQGKKYFRCDPNANPAFEEGLLNNREINSNNNYMFKLT